MLWHLYDVDTLRYIGKRDFPKGVSPGNGTILEPDNALKKPAWNTVINEWVEYVVPPRELTEYQFQQHAANQLGGGLVGGARFISILQAIANYTHEDGSQQLAVMFAYEQYKGATSYERDPVLQLLSFFVSLGIGGLTQTEVDDIINNWPGIE